MWEFLTVMAEGYGPLGLALVFMGLIWWRQSKRLQKLEERHDELEGARFDDYRKMIEDYTDLVSSVKVTIANLSGCIKSLKETQDRIERKLE